jgi:hypothetical protein
MPDKALLWWKTKYIPQLMVVELSQPLLVDHHVLETILPDELEQ